MTRFILSAAAVLISSALLLPEALAQSAKAPTDKVAIASILGSAVAAAACASPERTPL